MGIGVSIRYSKAMHIKGYVKHIKQGTIPPYPPDGLEQGGYPFTFNPGYYNVRSECISLGLWVVIDKIWTHKLAQWIGRRKIIEIMAGGGWLAKALSFYGVDITATDNYSWNSNGSIGKQYPVKRMTAIKAARLPGDILLVSWPPYEDKAICRACKVWGEGRPIIYIGEDKGGCNATDEFFEHFKTIKYPDFGMVSWDGIHDRIKIGYWQGDSNNGLSGNNTND